MKNFSRLCPLRSNSYCLSYFLAFIFIGTDALILCIISNCVWKFHIVVWKRNNPLGPYSAVFRPWCMKFSHFLEWKTGVVKYLENFNSLLNNSVNNVMHALLILLRSDVLRTQVTLRVILSRPSLKRKARNTDRFYKNATCVFSPLKPSGNFTYHQV
jgi:hypothetical protein